MSEWQPIETAPKDGTVIILRIKRYLYSSRVGGVAHDGGFSVLDGSYRASAEGHMGWQEWCGSVNSWSSGSCDPTHWMPLPESPDTKND